MTLEVVMNKVIAILLVLLFTASVAAQDKYPEDRKLIAQAARDLGREPVKKEQKPEPKVQKPYRPGYYQDRYAYNPGRSPLLDFDIGQNPSYYDRILQERAKRDEATALLKAEATRVIPTGIEDDLVVYPDNWVEKTKKREKYKHGEIAKGEPDENGKYVVIYDISDLIYEPPNFESPYSSIPAARTYNPYLDCYDLFGRIEPEIRRIGPHYSAEEAERIAELIRTFLRDDGEVYVSVPAPKQQD
jgi:hypothetical protein